MAKGLSQYLDSEFGSTRGTILYRGAGGWLALAPGTSGQTLQTNGAGADPTWTTPAGGSDPWTKLVVSSNITENAGTATTILGFSAAASTKYLLRATLVVTGDSSNIGPQFAMSLPTGASSTLTMTGPAGFNSTSPMTGTANDSGNFTSNSGSWFSGNAKGIIEINIYVLTSTTAGTVNLQYRKNGSGVVTVFAGSSLLYRTL